MKLNIPKQSAATAQSVPCQPKKLKKTLAALPNTNMGELTKQSFHILRDLNRQTMPSKQRLENLELLRDHTRIIFSNLKKYFINRTLPLPDKSQKIVNLNQSILQELIHGYEIIAFEAAHDPAAKVDDKTLSIAICRAINYLSEMLLRSCEVYAICPKNLWLDAHQLYTFAESKNLVDIPVDNNQQENENSNQTIANNYKQILLFTLARPITLRQSDSERIYNGLFEWSKYSSIQKNASVDQIDQLFSIHMDQDSPPDYLEKSDFDNMTDIRLLNTDKLVSHIKNVIEEQSKKKQKLAVGNDIPLETLQNLVTSWGVAAKRRFSRAGRRGRINVTIGLANSVKAIHDSTKPENAFETKAGIVRPPDSPALDTNFTLEEISNNKSASQNYITDNLAHSLSDNSWDMVAKGVALTENYADSNLTNNEQLESQKTDDNSHWVIVNVSAGGYCLRWNSDKTSKAQVGELISLQEFNTKNDFEWYIGTIRWMQFTQENGLEIGVQVLSPKVMTATAQRINRPHETPFDCLMLPGIKALNQLPSMLLPSHAFKTDDKLVVYISENKLEITLQETKESTGSFTQFTYKNTAEDQRVKKQAKKAEANKNKDDFDELWSSL